MTIPTLPLLLGCYAVAINGATYLSYTLGMADIGAVVRILVTVTNPDATDTAVSNATGTVVGSGPFNNVRPTISGTAQRGITLCTLVLGVVAEPAIAHLLEPVFDAVGVPHGLVHPISFGIALTVATYLHMLIGEMVPKNIALAAPVGTALLLGPPLVALTRALRPFRPTLDYGATSSAGAGGTFACVGAAPRRSDLISVTDTGARS